jgi:hypothetical protein
MKRIVCATLALALLVISAPDASAQVSAFVGGGVTIPMGDFADFNGDAAGDEGANTGWQAAAGVLFAVGESGLSVGGRGFYGSNNHDTEGDKTNLYGATGLATFAFGSGTISPFIYGELGFLTHSYKSDTFEDESSSGLALGGGAGLTFPLGGLAGHVVAGYMMGSGDVDGTDLVGISAGVNIPFGGGM